MNNDFLYNMPRIPVHPLYIKADPRIYKELGKKLKDECINYSNNRMEGYNARKDREFNQRHPNTQGDIFDKFNNGLTQMLYSADENLGTGSVGHAIATAGRVTRDNYELHYERSPFTDKFERSYHAFTNATDLGL